MLREGNFIGDRYEIVAQIGSGGMAEVYKAKDHKLNRFIAVKVMKSEFRDDQSFISKFRAEAQAAAGLSHPNIVNVYDVGDENGIYYIVMELVEGITLKDYIIKKGKLSVRETISIAMQVSMGLEAAHNNNIVHRDIKPQNIIISTDGKVKVTDFGIARAASANTISSNVMGSVHYSSPEQVRGGYSDEKSDIYSLGITMYEMVTGKVPYDGETTVAIAIKHLQEEMILPSKFAADLPLSLEHIILRCTQKSADRRYSTIDELIKDLKLSLVNPDGDFVQLTDLSQHAKTIMISREELEQIKSQKNSGREYEDADEIKLAIPSRRRDVAADDLDDIDELDDDEEDDDAINPRLERAMMTGGIIAGVLILIILLALVGYALGMFRFPSANKNNPTTQTETTTTSETATTDNLVEVPDLYGKTFEAAQLELNQLGLGLIRDTPQHSDSVAVDLILSQSHASGDKVERNTQISVVISSGEELITLPSISTYNTLAELEEALKQLSLTTSIEEMYHDTIEKGMVISTRPGATSQVKKGSAVVITISKGKELIKLPNVMSYTRVEAEAELERLGLRVKVEEGYNVQAADTVYNQFPAANTEVVKGSEVIIYVTKAKIYELRTSVYAPASYEGGPILLHYQHGNTKTLIFDWTEGVNFPQTIESRVDHNDGKIIITERRYTDRAADIYEDIDHVISIPVGDYKEIIE